MLVDVGNVRLLSSAQMCRSLEVGAFLSLRCSLEQHRRRATFALRTRLRLGVGPTHRVRDSERFTRSTTQSATRSRASIKASTEMPGVASTWRALTPSDI